MRRFGLLLTLAACLLTSAARAEVDTVRIAKQWGLAWMPFVLMERDRIIERRAAEAGLGAVKVEWVTFSGGNVMNDALLSGNLDYATTGIPGFLILWDRARAVLPVRAVSGFGSLPFALLTRSPQVKTLADFTSANRIALPTAKISGQAIVLQMAAEKAFGPGQQDKLDNLTVSLSHPDGMANMLSGKSEITAHFTSAPFMYQEIEDRRAHKVLDSLKEAIDSINADKRRAAERYLEITKENMTADQIVEAISEPLVEYSLVPHNVFTVATFMHRVGSLKTKPDTWKDLFFPDVHHLPGS